MLKRDELANPESCINKAADDEPVFVLRANDENAPAIVTEWCREYIVSKGGWSKLTEEQRKKYNEAMHLASDMRIWKMHQHKRRAGV